VTAIFASVSDVRDVGSLPEEGLIPSCSPTLTLDGTQSVGAEGGGVIQVFARERRADMLGDCLAELPHPPSEMLASSRKRDAGRFIQRASRHGKCRAPDQHIAGIQGRKQCYPLRHISQQPSNVGAARRLHLEDHTVVERRAIRCAEPDNHRARFSKHDLGPELKSEMPAKISNTRP
jgi:hypothetical protein